MLKTMRKANIKGFSLVELMVVVAIIGILAAVAIPNFQRFQRRSRQAEGKSSLGSIHQAETVFFQSYDTFYASLSEINVPTPVGTIFYNAGFGAVDSGADLIARVGTNLYPKVVGSVAALEGSIAFANICVAPCVQATGGQMGQAGWPTAAIGAANTTANTTGSSSTFTAEARAWIGGAAEDVWTITEQKIMMQSSDGVQ